MRTVFHEEVVVMLMRFDPFRELDRLVQPTRFVSMPLDAYRDGDHFVVNIDLPGVDPDSIDLSVERDVLTVSAERTWNVGDEVTLVANERPQGNFTRQLFLGESLDTDRIDANYDLGVLTIRLPVAEAAKPRKVQITSGQGRPEAIEASSSVA